MANLLNSILQKEISNNDQIILYLMNGGWKAYETSARNLSYLLGDKSCQKETFQDRQLDTLYISQETLINSDLVEYCDLVADNMIILNFLQKATRIYSNLS